MNIQKTSTTLDNNGIVAVIYAESGVGKTTALAEIGTKTLIIDFDGGTGVLADKSIDYQRIEPDMSNYEEVMKALKEDETLLKKYDTIAFDSITFLETNMLADYARNSKSQVPTLQNYGQLNARLQQALIDMRSLKFKGKNVIITALEQVFEEIMEDGSSISKIYPMLSAKKGLFAKKLVAEVDICGHLEISNKEATKGKRFIRLAKTENVIAKDRIFKRAFCEPKDIFTKTEGDK